MAQIRTIRRPAVPEGRYYTMITHLQLGRIVLESNQRCRLERMLEHEIACGGRNPAPIRDRQESV